MYDEWQKTICSLNTTKIFRSAITRSSAIASRPAQHSVLVEMLFYCCTNNANKSLISLRSIFSNCHVLFHYLHSFIHVSFNYRTVSTGCCGCYQPTSVPVYNQPCWCQLDRNCNHQISTSNGVKCWWHCIFVCQCTIMDAGHHDRWTQIFCGMASQPQSSGQVIKRNFYLPHLHFTPPLVVILSEFRRYLIHHKNTESMGHRAALSAWSYV